MLYLAGIYLVEEGEVVEYLQEGKAVVIVGDALLVLQQDGEQAAEVEVVVRFHVVFLQGRLCVDDRHQLAYVCLVYQAYVLQFVLVFLRIIYLVVGIAQHQLVECLASVESALWRLSQEAAVQVSVGSLRDVVDLHDHTFLQVVHAHARCWRNAHGESLVADGWHTVDEVVAVVEHTGETGVVEEVVDSHVVDVLGDHVSHGKHVAAIGIDVLHVGMQQERHVLVLEGVQVDFTRVVRYHVADAVEGAHAFHAFLYDLALEHQVASQLLGDDDVGIVVDVQLAVLLLGCLSLGREERLVDICPQSLVVLDGGAHLATQVEWWLLVELHRQTVPQSHSGRQRQVEVLLVQVLRLYGDHLLGDGEHGLLVLVLGVVEVLHLLVVLLRAEHVGEDEGIVAVEREGCVKLGACEEREERPLERLVRVAHVHDADQAIEKGLVERGVEKVLVGVLAENQLRHEHLYHALLGL